MNGIVQSVDEKTGQYGKFSEVTIDGRAITAFKEFHTTASRLLAGDSVSYSFELKGKYPRFTSLAKSTGDPAPEVSLTPGGFKQAAKPAEFITRDESVLVSYAKDIMIAKPDLAPSQAVDAIMELVALVKKGMKENPTS